MTQKINQLCSTLLIVTCLGAVAGCNGGCAALDPGADPLVVRAEQTAEASFELIDAFLLFEQNNRAALPAEITHAADLVRADAPLALQSLRSATQAYKQNRTDANAATLETWIATVAELKRIAQQNLGKAQLDGAAFIK